MGLALWVDSLNFVVLPDQLCFRPFGLTCWVHTLHQQTFFVQQKPDICFLKEQQRLERQPKVSTQKVNATSVSLSHLLFERQHKVLFCQPLVSTPKANLASFSEISFSEQTNEVWSQLKVSMQKANATRISLSHLLFERQHNIFCVNLLCPPQRRIWRAPQRLVLMNKQTKGG